jgi:hypothetical protein
MGFWSYPSDSASPPKPKISADGTPIAPNRTERSKCWEARDIYFQCLDKHDIVDSIKEGEKAAKECPVEEKGFATNCASSWVSGYPEHSSGATLLVGGKGGDKDGGIGTFVKRHLLTRVAHR